MSLSHYILLTASAPLLLSLCVLLLVYVHMFVILSVSYFQHPYETVTLSINTKLCLMLFSLRVVISAFVFMLLSRCMLLSATVLMLLPVCMLMSACLGCYQRLFCELLSAAILFLGCPGVLLSPSLQDCTTNQSLKKSHVYHFAVSFCLFYLVSILLDDFAERRVYLSNLRPLSSYHTQETVVLLQTNTPIFSPSSCKNSICDTQSTAVRICVIELSYNRF